MYSLIWKKKKKSFFPLYTLQFSAKKENKHRAGGPHFSNECFQAESDWFTREYHDHLSPLGLKITPFFCFLFNFSVVVTKPPFVQIVDELKKKKTNNPRGIVVSYLSLISICSRTRRGLFWESLSVRCVAFLFCFPSLFKKKIFSWSANEQTIGVFLFLTQRCCWLLKPKKEDALGCRILFFNFFDSTKA